MNKKVQFKINRVKSLLVIFICLFLGMSNVSASSMIQAKLQKKISLNLKDVSLRVVLEEMQKQSKVGFVYKYETDLESLITKSVSLSNVTVEEALNHVFRNTPFTYKIINDAVTIIKHTATQQAKRFNLNGKVIDGSTKRPIVGATVIVLGTSTGYITDENGAYSINITVGESIEVSFVGMKQVVKKIGSEIKELNITMELDQMNIESVVVTGYGNVAKRNYTGAVTTVKAEDILVAGAGSIDQMLQGIVPGMLVQTRTGMVGASPKIRVRGTSTLLGNQEPVWVVDGVIDRKSVV